MTPAVSTLNELLRGYITAQPDAQTVGTLVGDRVIWLSTAEVAERIRAVSLGLQALGVRQGDRVALLAENRWEWMVGDFAILAAGAVNVPLHPGLSSANLGYILANSGARAALVSTRELTALLLESRRQAPQLTHVIAFDERACGQAGVQPLSELMRQGRAHGESHQGLYRATRDAVAPGDLASLIYTSGTTGDPKGVMLTHSNFASNVSAAASVFDFKPTDVALSFLPLCHVFERTVDYTYYHSRCTVVHLPDLRQVAEALLLVRPTVFASVPRLYEKIYSRIQASVPPGRRRLFDWAVGVGQRVLRRTLDGRTPGPWLAAQHALADRWVFQKILKRLGGRPRFTISGGAPLSPEMAAFFMAIGLKVLEGYGLTETSPVITTNRIDSARPGTVGPPLPGVEVRIAEDGEVLTRGPHVMKGYWQAPEKTAEAIDADGWLHTGDVGRMDEHGHLHITDRKKEIIVTAQGKNVAPQPVENAIKTLPLVSQVALVGDRRPFLVALVVPDLEVLEKQAEALGVAGLDLAGRLAHPAVHAAVEVGIRQVTAEFDHHEQVRRFVLLPREFSLEEDELTPTLKLKRRVIEEHYATDIRKLYAGQRQARPVGV